MVIGYGWILTLVSTSFEPSAEILGQDTFPDEQLPHLDGMKEFLFSEVALAGMAALPAEVRGLFETFLRQVPASLGSFF